jgi:hypothetical protein
MKIGLYVFSVICLMLCGLNIWCIATRQPSNLHLNGLAAVVTGFASVICFFVAKDEC